MKTKSPIGPIITFSIIIAIFLVAIFSFKAIKLNLGLFNKKQEPVVATVKEVVPPKSADETEIVLTEQDIQKYILANSKDMVSEATVSITEDGVLIEGKADVIVKTTARLKLLPEIINGEFNLKIVEAKTGFINAPKWVVDKLNALITDYLEKNINGNNTVTRFILEKGKITIRVKGLEL